MHSARFLLAATLSIGFVSAQTCDRACLKTTLDQYLNAVTDAGFAHLVLDCGRLDYLSSAGIGILAATIKRCREGKGDMLLCSVEDKMRRVMQIIGLLSLVKTYENEKTATASFKST